MVQQDPGGNPLSAASLTSLMATSLSQDANPQIKNAYEAIALAVHAGMISVGFKLKGLGEDHRIGMCFYSFIFNPTDAFNRSNVRRQRATATSFRMECLELLRISILSSSERNGIHSQGRPFGQQSHGRWHRSRSWETHILRHRPKRLHLRIVTTINTSSARRRSIHSLIHAPNRLHFARPPQRPRHTPKAQNHPTASTRHLQSGLRGRNHAQRPSTRSFSPRTRHNPGTVRRPVASTSLPHNRPAGRSTAPTPPNRPRSAARLRRRVRHAPAARASSRRARRAGARPRRARPVPGGAGAARRAAAALRGRAGAGARRGAGRRRRRRRHAPDVRRPAVWRWWWRGERRVRSAGAARRKVRSYRPGGSAGGVGVRRCGAEGPAESFWGVWQRRFYLAVVCGGGSGLEG